MKGVRPVLERSEADAAEPGIWLSLHTLIELPFALPIRLDLLRWLLRELECDGHPAESGAESRVHTTCCTVLLANVVEAELQQACDSLEQGAWQEGRRAWQAALEHHQHLQQLRPGGIGLGRLMDGLIQILARLDQALTHRQWRPPTSPLENAQVHADAAALLQRIRDLDQPRPDWFEVVEEGLLRRGALALLRQSSDIDRREGIALLLRHTKLHPPMTEGSASRLELALLELLEDLDQSSNPVADLGELVNALDSLGVVVGSDQGRQREIQDALALARGCLLLAAEATQPQGLRWAEGVEWEEAIEPAQIREQVEDWLEEQSLSGAPLRVELLWIPGARAVPHGQGQLAFNLAAMPPGRGHGPKALQNLLAALQEPLLQFRHPRGLDWRHPATTLLPSLRQLWSGDGALTWEDCQLLTQAQAAWQTTPRPPFPDAHFVPGCCVVQPSATQLAAIRCWLLQPDLIEPSLAAIRRHHHDAEFMQVESSRTGPGEGDVLQSLCALHAEEGFYASTTDAVESVQSWARGWIEALAEAQWLADLPGPSASGWAVLQGVMQHCSRLPELVAWPEEERFYGLLARQEVLVVSPLAPLIQEQHRSGRAFALFRDLEIEPYGLRTLTPPASGYPRRPHRSFETSLTACLEELHGMARERPFTVFLCVAGAYDLPLCHAVRQRYGASCVAIGASLHARFGVAEPSWAHWRREQRRADHWRRIC